MEKKVPFDKSAFVFKVDLSVVEKAIASLVDKQEDINADKLTASEEYWLGRWLTDLPLYHAHHHTTALLCAQESAALGIYKGGKKKPKTKAKKDKK